MQFGKEKEQRMLARCMNYIQASTGNKVTLEPTGLLIHPQKCWLEAAPDAVVIEKDGSKRRVELKQQFPAGIIP